MVPIFRLSLSLLACAAASTFVWSAVAQSPLAVPGSRPALSAKVNGMQAPAGKWAIVMHGGAGVIERSTMTPERDKQYRAGLDDAMQAAAKVLNANGSAVDAVEAGLRVLEDNLSLTRERAPYLPLRGAMNLMRR